MLKSKQIRDLDVVYSRGVKSSMCSWQGWYRCEWADGWWQAEADVKNHFFSSYVVSVAQETGRNSPCGPFRLGCFYFLYMLYWVFLHPHCVWKCSREICFNMTIICSMGLLYSARNLAVAFHGQLQRVSDLLVDVTTWTIRKIKTFLFNLKLRFKKQEI